MFEGDTYIASTIAAFVRARGVRSVVETGTCTGKSTAALAMMDVKVHSIEIDKGYFDKAKEHLQGFDNVGLHQGNSPDVMRMLLPRLPRPILFYLDAHWHNYWPLRDELRSIAVSGPDITPLDDSIIVIHDFKNPHVPTLGYDTYDGRDLDWKHVEDIIEEIYPSGYAYKHNTQAHGARRGVVYIYPEYAHEG